MGSFVESSVIPTSSDFMFSDFLGEKIYCFNETNEEFRDFHFSSVMPEVIEHYSYIDRGLEIINQLNEEILEKVVYSRVKKLEFKAMKSYKAFEQLCHEYPDAFVYLVSSSLFGTWIGASPECLVRWDGMNGETSSLAGTKKISDDTPWQRKEKNEQQMVTDFIEATLKSIGTSNIVLNGPDTYTAGPVKHLRTSISFQLKGNHFNSAIKALHPTPAMSGLPRELAISVIQASELHNRGLYTGILGFSRKDKGLIYVNVRCCQIFSDCAYLYVGGGYTSESTAQAEWDETENKSRTLLNIFDEL